tara:strand:- start:32791 stop:34704 length:1914 start_codon:yes stop_codon:yes gene_type:complete
MLKEIKESKLIVGILKEAFFLNCNFVINLHNEKAELELLDIFEPKQRSDAFENKLIFKTASKIDNKVSDLNISFNVEDSIISFDSEIEKIDNNEITLKFPSTIKLKNGREQKRLKVEDLNYSYVLIKSQQTYYQSLLKVRDISEFGIGAYLKCGSNITPSIGDSIHGKFHFKNELIEVSHKITQINYISSNNYSIGLKSINGLKKDKPYKRSTSRFKFDSKIDLLPLINEDYSFTLEIKDISVTGFKAKNKIRNDERPYFSVGSIYRSNSFNVSFELIYLNKDYLGFKLLKPDSESALKWLKFFSKEINEDISTKNYMNSSILQMFCSSGALSADYINNHKHKSEHFKNYFTKENDTSFWLYRWVSFDDEHNPNGHIATLKLASNLWILGDIVGSQDKENKMPKDLRENFMSLFSDWSLSINNVPKHLVMWIDNHPYWKDYENYISNNKEYILEETALHYSRVNKQESYREQYRGEIREIKNSNFALINNILKESKKCGFYELLNSFDFNTTNFASSYLKEEFKRNKLRLLKKFFHYSNDKYECVVMYSKFPEGSSLNRVGDSIWIFELNSSSKEQWEDAKNQIEKKAFLLGIDPPSIRRVAAPGSSLKENEIVTLKSYILHPYFWKDFEDKKGNNK